MESTVLAKGIGLRIVADVTGLDDYDFFSVMGMWAVPLYGHNAACSSVIERKGSEVFSDKDYGKSLAFV